MAPGGKKQIDVARLKADLAAASVELLSAHCAADRVRLRCSLQDIVQSAEQRALQRAIASVQDLHRFFPQVEALSNQQQDPNL
jgi:hypothetical protein